MVQVSADLVRMVTLCLCTRCDANLFALALAIWLKRFSIERTGQLVCLNTPFLHQIALDDDAFRASPASDDLHDAHGIGM